MDTRRRRIYGLTWPTGIFFRHDLGTRETKTIGRFFLDGEKGTGARYRTVCRSLAVDPDDGSVYFTQGEGTILRYRYADETVTPVAGDNMKKDYFGRYDPATSGHMAYNWRQVVYRPADRLFYGVHGNSGYLFSFDPRAEKVEVLDRITSAPSKRSGMADQFPYGYLGFTLGPDGRTVYYLTGGPVARKGGADALYYSKPVENLHLVTYDVVARAYTDHGAIVLPDGGRPLGVNAIAVGLDGTVYTLARISTAGGGSRVDLISVKPAGAAPTAAASMAPAARIDWASRVREGDFVARDFLFDSGERLPELRLHDLTRGHGTHSWPALWREHLERLLQETGPVLSCRELES
jgi:hypothetical protein